MSLLAILEQIAASDREMPRTKEQLAKRASWRYQSFAEFVAVEGHTFQSQELTAEELQLVRGATDKYRAIGGKFAFQHCYANSQILVQLDPTGRLQYAEGYARDLGGGLPFLHGWVVLNDKVIDLTGPPTDPWNLPDEPPQLLGIIESREYRGVVFPRSQVFKRFGFFKGWGCLIDNWQDCYPLLRHGRTGRPSRSRKRAPEASA